MSRQKNRLISSAGYTDRRKTRGFTLLEIMVVVAILGILAAISLPAFRSFIVGQGIKSAAFDLMATLTLARSEAIKRNTTIAVTPNGNWQDGWTVAFGTAPNITVISQKSALKSGLVVTCSTGGTAAACPANVTYNDSGRLSAAAPSFIVSSAETTSVASRCISITLSGLPTGKKVGC